MKTLASVITLATIAWPASALAHHILGIPHYKYSEEYPQIPFVEVMAETAKHDLHFTYFPGTPRPGERVRFKLYIKGRDDGAAYKQALEVRFLQQRFLRDPVLVDSAEIEVGVGPEGNDYKFFHTFDDAEAYLVELQFVDGERIERIPFPVHIGETDDRPLIGGAFALLAVTVLFVGVSKRRRAHQLQGRTS